MGPGWGSSDLGEGWGGGGGLPLRKGRIRQTK